MSEQRIITAAMATTNNNTFIESRGDYAEDEDAFNYAYSIKQQQEQLQLPRLPVPTLEQTIATFLPTALPLATSEEERESLQRACSQFPAQARVLQQRLLLLQQQRVVHEKKNASWLQTWWNQEAYLKYRESNALHVSYFFRLPSILHKNDDDNRDATTTTSSSIRVAARCLQSMVTWARHVQQQHHHVQPQSDDTSSTKNNTPSSLCSAQFKYLLNACRIPRPDQDVYRMYDARIQNMLYATVACRGQFYRIPLLVPPCDSSTDDGDDNDNRQSMMMIMYSQESLEQALLEIRRQSSEDHNNNNNEYRPPLQLGWLTGAHRDHWSKVYPLLSDSSPTMAEDLTKLSSSLFLLCLDDDIDDDDGNSSSCSTDETVACRLWHGDITQSANRWFDKSIQLVVNSSNNNDNGKTTTTNLGLIGEHSMADGMPVMGLCQHLLEDVAASSSTNDTKAAAISSNRERIPIEPLFRMEVSSSSQQQQQHLATTNVAAAPLDSLQSHIDHARLDLTHRIQRHELRLLHYPHWGATTAKHNWKCSPDAAVQMAMQLAASRVMMMMAGDEQQRAVATYESTHTRVFRHGRTETTRSVSPASVAFCQSMNNATGGNNRDDNALLLEQWRLFQEATATHSAYSRLAAQGLGVDRHFFGLSMILAEHNNNNDNNKDDKPPLVTPDLFQHPCYLRSKRWRLSTSTLPGTRPGFGNVEEDGIGIGYDVQASDITFTITGCREYNLVTPMRDAIRQALDDIERMATAATSKTPPLPDIRSKL